MRVVTVSVVALFVAVASATAAPITVHNTGVDSSDALVSAGAQSAFWELLSGPTGFTETLGSNPFAFLHGAYASNTSTSQWVSPASSGNASVGGIYVYGLEIDLTGLDPDAAVITGLFSTDNDGFIRLNGGAPVASIGFAGFGTLQSFTIDSGFVAGINTIEVGVNNGGNPTAFHVQFTEASSDPVEDGDDGGDGNQVPEPVSLALLGTGLAAVAAARRRRIR